MVCTPLLLACLEGRQHNEAHAPSHVHELTILSLQAVVCTSRAHHEIAVQQQHHLRCLGRNDDDDTDDVCEVTSVVAASSAMFRMAFTG